MKTKHKGFDVQGHDNEGGVISTRKEKEANETS